MALTQPTTIPKFCEKDTIDPTTNVNNAIAVPTDLINYGWQPAKVKPARSHMNWLLRHLCIWAAHCDEVSKAVNAIDTKYNQALVEVHTDLAAEAKTRGDTDTLISGHVTDEVTRLTTKIENADSTLSTAISTEATTRAAADVALGQRIDAVTGGGSTSIKALSDTVAVHTTTLAQHGTALTQHGTAITANASAITAETNERVSRDNTIISRVVDCEKLLVYTVGVHLLVDSGGNANTTLSGISQKRSVLLSLAVTNENHEFQDNSRIAYYAVNGEQLSIKTDATLINKWTYFIMTFIDRVV